MKNFILKDMSLNLLYMTFVRTSSFTIENNLIIGAFDALGLLRNFSLSSYQVF